MKHLPYLFALCFLVLTSCKESFKKGDQGLEYRIISAGNGKKLKNGDYVQFHMTNAYNGGTKDSILDNSRDFGPSMFLLDSNSLPPAYYKIFRQANQGDSFVIRVLTDSAYKSQPQSMPPFMKKGRYLYTYIKFVNVFQTKEQADSANQVAMAVAIPRKIEKNIIEKNKQQLAIDDKIIADYLARNNIKAERTKWGTYITVQAEGTGEKINSQSIVSINYTGKTLDSAKVFDSNVDPKFSHVGPYTVNMAQPEVIVGWIDALMQLKKGAKATIYVPSSLGYGTGGNGEMIKANDNLVFDLDIADVQTQEGMIARQREMQQKIMDSLQKAQKK